MYSKLKKKNSKPPADLGGIKMGPMIFDSGKKKMLVMTPPVNTFQFKMDAIRKLLKKRAEDDDQHAFDQVFLDTLNSLTAEVLLYFQNRLHLSTAQKVPLTSVPAVKAQYKKLLGVEISELIGTKAYSRLKALDRQRGDTQHGNDRYFMDHRVGNQDLNSAVLLSDYVSLISGIVLEFDQKIEDLFPIFQQRIVKDSGSTSIEYQSTTHSYDLKTGKVKLK